MTHSIKSRFFTLIVVLFCLTSCTQAATFPAAELTNTPVVAALVEETNTEAAATEAPAPTNTTAPAKPTRSNQSAVDVADGLPSPTAKPTIAATETPQPTIATTADDWFIYDSAYYSYTIAYPPEAKLHTQGVSGFATDEQPADLTFEEYMKQLQETYPQDICLLITYDTGFVSVVAPFENGGKYADVCPGTGIGYDMEPISKTVMVNDMPYLAEGFSTLETDDGVWHGEFLMWRLEDGTGMAMGGGFDDQTTREEYAALEQVLLRIVNSFTSTTHLTATADGEGQNLQLLLTTSKDSLALWQDGELTVLPDTEGVFSAVFVGASDTIVYVRGHEVWCMDMNTQAAHQIPLPPEILATIPDDNDWPEFLFWLTAVNNNQIVATVEQATTPYGTVLVDCDTSTSTAIELTNPGYPVVSPDSSKIAIAGTEAITVYDLVSGESKVLLTFEPIATYTQAPFYPVLSWAADSTHLVTVIHPPDWWMEDVDEPTIVYRLYPESGEVETVASFNRMLVREPSTAVPFAADKLAYSVPADPAVAPFGIIPTKQMILDLENGAETLLFEDTAGFVGWDPLSGVTGFTGWNPTGERISFWQGDRPDQFEIGVYDFGTESRLEKRLPGKFSGWLTDSAFLYTVEDTLYNTLYYASIVDADFVTAELVPKIDRLHEARWSN